MAWKEVDYDPFAGNSEITDQTNGKWREVDYDPFKKTGIGEAAVKGVVSGAKHIGVVS